MTQDDLLYSVPIRGDDAELQALGAIVHLLEKCSFGEPGRPESLTPVQKDGIAKYLAARYYLP